MTFQGESTFTLRAANFENKKAIADAAAIA
jgi:hypothetical protein